jgi:hypothetical protein
VIEAPFVTAGLKPFEFQPQDCLLKRTLINDVGTCKSKLFFNALPAALLALKPEST